MIKNENEILLHDLLNQAYHGQWVREYRGIEATAINKKGKEYRRMFRFDCANPTLKIAIEIEGAIWTYGRHNQPTGMIQDMTKYNLAVLEGWRVLRYTTDTVRKCPARILEDVRVLCGEDSKQTKLGEPKKNKLL